MNSYIGPTKDKDQQFTKSLLDASEKHNKNLSELIVILKKNIEEEKGKVSKLTKDNSELKRDLGSKQLNVKKLEKELLISKQNEQKLSGQVQQLQDSLEKYRVQLVSIQQKTKGDDNVVQSQNSGISISNLGGGGLVERTSSIYSLKYNNSAFFNNIQESKDSTPLNNKKQGNTNAIQLETKQTQKEIELSSTNPSISHTSGSHTNNIQYKANQKYQNLKVPNTNEKENSGQATGSKLSFETTDSKRKPFYSIHQPSTYQNQTQIINNKTVNNSNSNSFYQEALQSQNNNTQNLTKQQQQFYQQDTQSFQKPNNNTRGTSCNEIDSQKSGATSAAVTNNISANTSNTYQPNKKDYLGNYSFYNSKSVMQSKTNLAINDQNQQQSSSSQIQHASHSRYASETFSQKFSQQISKNTSQINENKVDASQNQKNIQTLTKQEYTSERGDSKKIDNQTLTEYINKNQGLNSVMNYLNTKVGQNTIFLNAGNATKNKKNDANLAKDNSSNSGIQLILESNQSSIYSPNIKNKSQEEQENKNVKEGDENNTEVHQRSNSISNVLPNYLSSNQPGKSTSNNQPSSINRLIFQEQTSFISPNSRKQQESANNEQIIQTNVQQISLINPYVQQEESKSFAGEKLSSIQNKKKIEEQVKSPKFLQRDTIDQHFSKMSNGQQYQSNNKSTNLYLKSRHESIGNNEGILSTNSRGNTNETSSQYTQNTQQIAKNNAAGNYANKINGMQHGEQYRSLSNQSKTIVFNGRGKKEEDVTITVEDVLDTIANVEEDADEAANLENLSGSHFKFMMKTSCKNLRIKTDQYFSKIENPSLATFNKKKQEFSIQQKQLEQNLLPSFGSLSNHFQNNYNYTTIDMNCPTYQYDPYFTSQNNPNISNNILHKDKINIDEISGNQRIKHMNEMVRLHTEEISKSISEKHQSVEIYNQINNKMTNFKYYTQATNDTPLSTITNQQIPHQVENVLERKIKNKYSIHEKKEPGKMKKYLEENQITDIGNRIFEGLMIYGPDKSEIKNLKSSSAKEIMSLSPQLYFKYPENSQIEKGREDVFQQFAFPFGVETQQISLTDSLSQLNEIIFSNNMAEANNNCFVFAVKSEESYKFQRNKEGSHFKQNEHQELLEICNPSNLLYGICFRVKEVIENGQNKNCWTTNKLFCFLTYYPFHRFFLDIISSMLNQMKMKRIEYFSKIQENIRNDPAVLSKLENEFFYNFLNKECKELLEELKKIALPSLSHRLQLNFNGESFAYLVPHRESAKHIEAEWGCSLVLSSFDKELFVNIFLSLLLEQSVVFVSSNSALLSSTMLLFHSLLKPFRWHHPLIFNLPNNFTHLMDIPVPILVGLNKDKNYVYQNQLAQRHENCLFVLLDENIELLNYDLISHISQSYFYENLLEKVSNFFEDLEKDSVEDPNIINYSNQNDSSNNNMSNSQNSNYKEILSHSNNNNSTSSNNNNNNNSNNNNNNNNNMLGSNTKKSTIFQHARSKSFIVNAATDAFNSLLGSKNKTSKVLSQNSQHQLNSNSTHRRKKTIITYPNIEEKKACMQILSTCTNFLNQDIISQMPQIPPYQTNTNMLNFDEMEKQMEKNIGRSDIFLHNLIKTQLFTVFAEEKYEYINI